MKTLTSDQPFIFCRFLPKPIYSICRSGVYLSNLFNFPIRCVPHLLHSFFSLFPLTTWKCKRDRPTMDSGSVSELDSLSLRITAAFIRHWPPLTWQQSCHRPLCLSSVSFNIRPLRVRDKKKTPSTSARKKNLMSYSPLCPARFRKLPNLFFFPIRVTYYYYNALFLGKAFSIIAIKNMKIWGGEQRARKM